MREKILITGGSGFLGKNLGLYLKLKNKYDVFLCSRNINNLKIAKNQTKCSVYPIDINNYASIVEAFSNIQPDIVVHSAAMKYVDLAEKFPEECIQTNVMGSINIFRVCKTFNIKKLSHLLLYFTKLIKIIQFWLVYTNNYSHTTCFTT